VLQLKQNRLIVHVIFVLLPQFKLPQKLFLGTRGVVNIQQNFRSILQIPLEVLLDITDVSLVYSLKELISDQVHIRSAVGIVVSCLT
jgi:hypothetical protein